MSTASPAPVRLKSHFPINNDRGSTMGIALAGTTVRPVPGAPPGVVNNQPAVLVTLNGFTAGGSQPSEMTVLVPLALLDGLGGIPSEPTPTAPRVSPAQARRNQELSVRAKQLQDAREANPARLLALIATMAFTPDAPPMRFGDRRLAQLLAHFARTNNAPCLLGPLTAATGFPKRGSAAGFLKKQASRYARVPLLDSRIGYDPLTGQRLYRLSERAWHIVRDARDGRVPPPSEAEKTLIHPSDALILQTGSPGATSATDDLRRLARALKAAGNTPHTFTELARLTDFPMWKVNHLVYSWGKSYFARSYKLNPDPLVRPERAYALTPAALADPDALVVTKRKKRRKPATPPEDATRAQRAD